MKRIIAIILIFQSFSLLGQVPSGGGGVTASAQTTPDLINLGKTFVMKMNFRSTKCDAVGVPVNPSSTEILERSFLITVDAVTVTDYVVSLPKFNANDELNERYVEIPGTAKVNAVPAKPGNAAVAATDATPAIAAVPPTAAIQAVPAVPTVYIYFLIPASDFSKLCEKATPRTSFTIGIPTIPAKLRFGNSGDGENPRHFRFDGNINLGLSGGIKWSLGIEKQYGFSIVGGFTIASVAVDSATTKGKVNANTSASSFSPHVGLIFDVQKFQLGIYSGIDFLYGEPNNYWVYRNQPWLGIGIGVSLFSVGGTKTNLSND